MIEVIEVRTLGRASKSATLLRDERMHLAAAERRRNHSALGDAVMHHGVGQPHGIGLDELEGILVQQTLLFYLGNRTRAAQSLGVARTTLYRMMKRHGLATGDLHAYCVEHVPDSVEL